MKNSKTLIQRSGRSRLRQVVVNEEAPNIRLSLLKCFSQVRGFRESFVAFVHNGSIEQIVLKIRSLYQL